MEQTFHNHPPRSNIQEVGYVLSIRGSLVYIDGLPGIKIMDMVENETGIRGVISGLEESRVEVWVLDEGTVVPGQLFKKTEKRLTIPASPALLGRAINVLGVPIDNKGQIPKTRAKWLDFERPAKPLKDRSFINTQLITGLTLVDTLIPIGKGQRQLIMGDPHSGKTSFLIDMISSATQEGIISIYASVGKPVAEVRKLIDILTAIKALSKSVFIAATATDPPPLIVLTPLAAFSVAEYFQEMGKDVLIILDDLGAHAKTYRELALLGNRIPGRESYPADMFYTHAHMLERAGKFNQKVGGGSITALPVIEIPLNDFTTYIPTNLMSMTDGHLLFKSSLRALGQHPSIDISLSVSRLGRQTQNRLQNALALRIRQVLSEAVSLDTISRFLGELPAQTQSVLNKRDLIMEAFKQERLSQISSQTQIVLLSLIFTSFFNGKDANFLAKHKSNIIVFFLKYPKLRSFVENVFEIKDLDKLIADLETIVPKLKEAVGNS